MLHEKREVLNLVENDKDWKRYSLIDDTPSVLVWEKPIRVIYKESDGRFMECTAVYTSTGTSHSFKALDGRAEGLYLANVVAFREVVE